MRILWLTHYVPWPPRGGILQRGHHLLRQATQRWSIRLVSLAQRSLTPSPAAVEEARRALEPLCESVSIFPIPADRSRLRWATMAARTLLGPTSYDAAWLHSRELHDFLAGLGRRERYDAVHVDTVGLWRYAAHFAGPFVLNHNNVESHMLAARAAQEPHPLRRAFLAREARKLTALEAEAARACAGNLVVSDLDRARLRAAVPGAAIDVVANGVDTDYFRARREPAPGAELLFAGGLSWYPNRDAIEHFLAAIWPALRVRRPECRCTIVGRNPFPRLLESARDPRIRVPGFVEDVRPYMDRAAAYICPIRSGGGTRLKILDALAMAMPLVATHFAVEGLGLCEEEHYLAADTPDAFVRQVERLLDDAALGRRLGGAGRRHVERHFSWHEIGTRLEQAYARALATPARTAAAQR